jgi:mono/diheme cytochrome c family protein
VTNTLRPIGLSIAALLLSAAAFAGEPDAKIARTFKAKCATCHGADGKADTVMGKKSKIPDFSTDAWQKGITDDQIKKSITGGVKKPGKEEMDAFGEKLSAEQIDGLVSLIRGLPGKK